MHHSHAHEMPTGGRLLVAALLTAVFAAIEGGIGIRANSLALITDAAHNLTDVGALFLAGLALGFARRPSTKTKTFGYHRVGILVALLNAVVLLVIAGGIVYEAIQRILQPQALTPGPMMLVAIGAILLNGGVLLMIRRDTHDLGVRGAYVHILSDLATALGILGASVAITLTEWSYFDPLMSLGIALFMLSATREILSEAINVLLEAAPGEVDVALVAEQLRQLPQVHDVHDLHLWSISAHNHALSCHLVIPDGTVRSSDQLLSQARELLARDFAIHHATIQIECATCPKARLYCDFPGTPILHGAEK